MNLALSEHLPLIASAPEGIQKLRNLILELAVRGKLVPQDPKDEPSDELLIKITKERARLVAEGGIKKSKAVHQVGADEQPFSLPKGWQWVRLATIGNIFNGNSINSSEKDSRFRRDDGVPYIATKDVGYGLTPLDYDNGVRIPESETNFRMARAGAVFICAEGGSAGKKCGLCDRDVFFGNKLFANETFSEIPPRFILYTYLSPFFREQFSAAMTGIIGGVSFAKFVELPIPIPPIKEQNRIVAKVEELMALCDRLEAEQNQSSTAHAQLIETLLDTLTQSTDSVDFKANWQRISEYFEMLFTTEVSIEALEIAILQLAVRGTLVGQDSREEPAFDLLNRITDEKNTLKWKKPTPVSPDEEPFSLPDSWEWVRFGSVAETRLGKMLDAAKNRGEAKPYLRNTNVQWLRFDLSDIKDMKFTEDELYEFRLLDGDLLICEGGEPGRCAIWRSDIDEMYFQKALHRARPKGGCLSEYLQIVLRQDAACGVLDAYFTGATIKHFPGEKLANYVIPLPPALEQRRIVAKVDELMAICSQLRSQLAESKAQESRLADTLIQNALSITA